MDGEPRSSAFGSENEGGCCEGGLRDLHAAAALTGTWDGFGWVLVPSTPLFSHRSAAGSALKIGFAGGSGDRWRRAPVTCNPPIFEALGPPASCQGAQDSSAPQARFPAVPDLPGACPLHSKAEQPTGHRGALSPLPLAQPDTRTAYERLTTFLALDRFYCTDAAHGQRMDHVIFLLLLWATSIH